METRQLEAFLAVVGTGTFAGAADELGTVQSSVSTRVRALEQDLGVRLFDRSRRTARLTTAGLVLAEEAPAWLHLGQDLRQHVLEADGGRRGSLRIGTINPIGHMDLPGMLAGFSAEHPHVQVSLRTDPAGSEGLLTRLRAHELDLAVVSLPARAVVHDLVTAPLASGALVLITPSGHPLAADAASPPTLAELSEHPWIDTAAGQAVRHIVDSAFSAAGLVRRRAVELSDLTAVPDFVASGSGIAMVPRFVVTGRSDVRIVDYTGPRLEWSTVLVHRPGRISQVAQRFWDHSLQHPAPA